MAVNPQIIEYLRRMWGQIPPEALRERLLQKGHHPQVVDEALRAVESESKTAGVLADEPARDSPASPPVTAPLAMHSPSSKNAGLKRKLLACGLLGGALILFIVMLKAVLSQKKPREVAVKGDNVGFVERTSPSPLDMDDSETPSARGGSQMPGGSIANRTGSGLGMVRGRIGPEPKKARPARGPTPAELMAKAKELSDQIKQTGDQSQAEEVIRLAREAVTLEKTDPLGRLFMAFYLIGEMGHVERLDDLHRPLLMKEPGDFRSELDGYKWYCASLAYPVYGFVNRGMLADEAGKRGNAREELEHISRALSHNSVAKSLYGRYGRTLRTPVPGADMEAAKYAGYVGKLHKTHVGVQRKAEEWSSLLRKLNSAPGWHGAYTAFRQGVLDLEAQRFDEARASLRKALELQPAYGEAHVKLAEVEMYRGRFKTAVKIAKRGVSHIKRRGPSVMELRDDRWLAEAYATLAAAYHAQIADMMSRGQPKVAKRIIPSEKAAIKKALAVNPRNERALKVQRQLKDIER